MIRLFSVFLSQILKQKSIVLEPMDADIHKFCIDFSNLKEVTNLTKQLQIEKLSKKQ